MRFGQAPDAHLSVKNHITYGTCMEFFLEATGGVLRRVPLAYTWLNGREFTYFGRIVGLGKGNAAWVEPRDA